MLEGILAGSLPTFCPFHISLAYGLTGVYLLCARKLFDFPPRVFIEYETDVGV